MSKKSKTQIILNNHNRSSMRKLFAKLDALTNLHYTPRGADAPEVKIVKNVPSISMEEVGSIGLTVLFGLVYSGYTI